MTETRTTKDVGELHQLLLKACPPSVQVKDKWVPVKGNKKGIVSNTVLAGLLGLSRWSVHKWAKTKHITPKRAKQVVEISEGRVTLEELSKYFY